MLSAENLQKIIMIVAMIVVSILGLSVFLHLINFPDEAYETLKPLYIVTGYLSWPFQVTVGFLVEKYIQDDVTRIDIATIVAMLFYVVLAFGLVMFFNMFKKKPSWSRYLMRVKKK